MVAQASIYSNLDKHEDAKNIFNKIDSVSLDGHKTGRMPYPAGFFICKNNLIQNISKDIEYTCKIDSTILGSRSGAIAAAAYATIKSIGTKIFEFIYFIGCIFKGCNYTGTLV